MHGHVPPGAAGRGEHHVAATALEHPRVVVRGQVSVEAAAAEDNTELRLRYFYVTDRVHQIFT